MFHPCVLFRTLTSILALMLLLAGCIMPAAEDETPVPAEPEMLPEDLLAIVNRNANVRTGPSTDYAIAY